jgi:hypothetical protein
MPAGINSRRRRKSATCLVRSTPGDSVEGDDGAVAFEGQAADGSLLGDPPLARARRVRDVLLEQRAVVARHVGKNPRSASASSGRSSRSSAVI